MKELEILLNRIVHRVNFRLGKMDFEVKPYINNLVPLNQMIKFYAFYGITPHHPLNFNFINSNLSGSYFLGKCRVTNSILYKSDIRGDELKKNGDVFKVMDMTIPLYQDEEIKIENSYLIKTLVHNYSHSPESLETFNIKDTISAPFANIHGSPSRGCFLGPFATVDLTIITDCVVGAFSYVQAGEISQQTMTPGTLWVKSRDDFNFLYQHPIDELNRYISFMEGSPPQGLFVDFIEDRKEAFQRVFDTVNVESSDSVPDSASVDRFAVIKPNTIIGENVLVCQRAYIQNSQLGKGANAQENCFIINSRLEGNNVTAHGAKIVEADLGKNVFTGFNSFLRGQHTSKLTIEKDCIIMPHTIIDIKEPLTIPKGQLVWGLIKNSTDLKEHSISLDELSKVNEHLSIGNMFFEGSGKKFVMAFKNRIQHILEANGAYYNGRSKKGHAQNNQNISFNTIQPYPMGDKEGMYPTIIIQP